jgi:tetratricopeptide (TPR) repeat protein
MEDPWLLVECMDWEAGALYLLERPEALAVATEALARCRDLKPIPIDIEVRILSHIAAIHTLHHEWGTAIQRYEEAIERSGNLRDLSRLGKMYNDLSLAYQEMGRLVEAAGYLHKALAVHEMQNNRQELAFCENNLGLVLVEQGELLAASQHLRTSLEMFDELKLERRRSHVLLSLSGLEMTRGDLEEAEVLAKQALDVASGNDEPMTAAAAHQTLGQLAAQRGDHALADRQFSSAIAMLGNLNAPKRLVECHTRYAEILESRGDAAGVVDHLKAAIAATSPELMRRPVNRRGDHETAQTA